LKKDMRIARNMIAPAEITRDLGDGHDQDVPEGIDHRVAGLDEEGRKPDEDAVISEDQAEPEDPQDNGAAVIAIVSIPSSDSRAARNPVHLEFSSAFIKGSAALSATMRQLPIRHPEP